MNKKKDKDQIKQETISSLEPCNVKKDGCKNKVEKRLTIKNHPDSGKVLVCKNEACLKAGKEEIKKKHKKANERKLA